MTTKLKATPGPWELHESGAIVGPKIDDKPIWLRPVIARFETGVKREDAILMSESRNMYAVLSELEESCEYWSEYDVPLGMVDRIKSALKRARGEA